MERIPSVIVTDFQLIRNYEIQSNYLCIIFLMCVQKYAANFIKQNVTKSIDQ